MNCLKISGDVKFDHVDTTANCSCTCLNKIGYLCSHVFCVFRVCHIEEIPSKYIMKHWSKRVLQREVYAIDNMYGVNSRPENVMKKEIIKIVNECVDLMRNDAEGLVVFGNKIKQMGCNMLSNDGALVVVDDSDEAVVEELLEQSMNVEVEVNNPNDVRTKSCGNKSRLIGAADKVSQKPPKMARLCATCKLYVTDHDSKNCKKIAEKKAAMARRGGKRTTIKEQG
ncbi:hypothetical protein SSX86_008087 [Deinandra increscens subsp. villosa]|uniref:SWIM-type domain-containing protein n=1 Tax=Deinandra increscens subsp. villosa TaxID=3103831 RepID=A0AAP0C920_9ASTR